MCGGGDRWELLKGIGHTDETRPAPYIVTIAEREGAIVIAAAHAETYAPGIEAHERQQHEIEPARADTRGALRFHDAEVIHTFAAAGQGFEKMNAPGAAIDSRQEHAAAARLGELDEGRGVQLFAHRCIDRDALTRTQRKGAIHVARDESGGVLARFRGELAALGTQLRPQGLADGAE